MCQLRGGCAQPLDAPRGEGRGNAAEHIGFGGGIHVCIGAPLARIELDAALSALVERAPGLALTAALTQQLLDGGRRFCFLFTDLANPTSNSIYQRIGYRPVSDVDLWSFD